MWLMILIVIALLFAAVVSVLSGGTLTLILVPLFVVAAVVAVTLAALGRLAGRDAPTVTSTQPAPTGKPRGTSAAPGTANDRVGQA